MLLGKTLISSVSVLLELSLLKHFSEALGDGFCSSLSVDGLLSVGFSLATYRPALGQQLQLLRCVDKDAIGASHWQCKVKGLADGLS